MNEVRFVKYRSKYQNENKIVDISTLPPCRSVLLLHSKRANYITCVGKEALKQMLNFQVHQITDESVNICWIEEPFPKDIEEILISENEVNDEEGKSDNKGDTF